jgi:hypothetical protein
LVNSRIRLVTPDLSVIADPGALAAGTYKGTLSLARLGLATPFAKIVVTFTVSPAMPAKLAVQPGALQISVTQGGSQQAQSFRVLNAGSGLSTSASPLPASLRDRLPFRRRPARCPLDRLWRWR